MYQNKVRVTPDVLATKGTRFANYIIDNIVMLAVGFVVGVVIALISELTGYYAITDFLIETDSRIWDYIFNAIITVVYYLSIEALTKRSIGKYVTKTKVVTHEGLEPTFNDILTRSFCRIIPFNALSFLGENGKGWHDSISKTYVVDIKKFEEKNETESELDQIGKPLIDY